MSRVLICAAESRKQHLMSGRRPSDRDLSPSLAFSRSRHPIQRLQTKLIMYAQHYMYFIFTVYSVKTYLQMLSQYLIE